MLDDPRGAGLPVYLRLRAAAAAGDHAAAVGLLEDPTVVPSPDALSFLVWVHLQRAEFRQAISVGRRAQVAGATGFALYANLGYAHAALGQVKKAIKLTRQAHVLAPLHRGVGLNLAMYLKLAGDRDASLALLAELDHDGHVDAQLALAMANVEVYFNQPERARRLLQRVRASSEWALADSVRRAELEANLALLRWKTGAANKHTTVATIRRALTNSDYQSLSIAYLLANLLATSRDALLLKSVIERLKVRHPADDLHALWMALALLEHDAPSAVGFARAWAQRDVLNPSAAALAVYLIGDLEGDYSKAGQLGLNSLKWAPSHAPLINNTAYALALAGRTVQAKKVIENLALDSKRVEVIATRALVEMLNGNVDRGLDGYERAWDRAVTDRDEPLADLVAANALLARLRAGIETAPDNALLDRLAKAADDRPGCWIISQRIQRELAIQLPAAYESATMDIDSAVDATHTYPLDFRSADSAPPQLPPASEH
jgi:Flp pilus assembly protein TadD